MEHTSLLSISTTTMKHLVFTRLMSKEHRRTVRTHTRSRSYSLFTTTASTIRAAILSSTRILIRRFIRPSGIISIMIWRRWRFSLRMSTLFRLRTLRSRLRFLIIGTGSTRGPMIMEHYHRSSSQKCCIKMQTQMI